MKEREYVFEMWLHYPDVRCLGNISVTAKNEKEAREEAWSILDNNLELTRVKEEK